jgi:F0F1-type ATP synthase delta subunit
MAKMEEIHMGRRLEHFVKNAKHGQGISGFSKYIQKSKSSVDNMYSSDSLDLLMISKVCEYYELTLQEFLGITESELIEALRLKPAAQTDIQIKLEKIDSQLQKILEKLN